MTFILVVEPVTESNDYVDQPDILQTTAPEVTTRVVADTTQYQPSWEETTEDQSYGKLNYTYYMDLTHNRFLVIFDQFTYLAQQLKIYS